MTISDILLGCTHPEYGWPRGSGSNMTVTCKDCFRELPYSWEHMKVVSKSGERRTFATVASVGGQAR